MEHLFKIIALWLHLHPTWAGAVTFLIAFFESLAIIGLLIPGSVTLSAIGMLVGSGVVPAVDIFVCAIIGAILGDGVSYWIGYRYHKTIRNVWPFRRFPKLFSKGEKFFIDHGGKSIFIGRFIGPVRPIMPLIAGTMRVRPIKFFSVDILSGILWAPAYMIPGIIAGATLTHFIPHRAFYYITVLLIILLIVWFIFWSGKRLVPRIIRNWMAYCNKIWQTLQHRHSFIYTLLYEHRQPNSARPLSLFLFTLVFAIVFLFFSISIILKVHWLNYFNVAGLSFFSSFHTSILQQIAIGLSIYLGKSTVLLSTSILLMLYFAIKNDWHNFYHFVALLVLSVGSIIICKHLTHHLRPQIVLLPPSNGSFPSGHTLLSLTVFGFIAFLISQNNKRWIKMFSYTLTIIIVSFVALSRLYLNVHWLSDIIGSILLGTCILNIIVLSHRHWQSEKIYHPTVIISLLLLGQLLFGSWFYHKHFSTLNKNYQLKYKNHFLNQQRWWHSTTSLLPIYRNNRFARPIQILNIQWLGSLNNIKNTLASHGWEKPAPFGYYALKQQFLGKKTIILPPLQKLFKHQKPVLVMIKPLQQMNSYLIIRLWDSHYHTQHESIYLGNISYHFPIEHWLWHKNKVCKTFYKEAINQLQPLSTWETKTIYFKEKYPIKNLACVKKTNRILLIRKNIQQLVVNPIKPSVTHN